MMSEVSLSPIAPEIAQPRLSEFRRITKVMFSRWVVVGGTFIILVLIATAVFAPLIAPYGSNEQNLNNILAHPSKSHLLGTDEVGRDLLTRIIYGSRISLLVGGSSYDRESLVWDWD
jgi:ABC-type dipeptide/oligopeptide/nickel transport system permease subunit